MNLKSARPGVSIVELAIVIALLGAVSMFIYAAFSAQIRLFVSQLAGINVSSQNQIALQELTDQTRQAESLVLTCPNPPCPSTEVGTTAASVVYRLSGLDTNGQPTNAYFDYVVFKQVGTNLIKSIYVDIQSTRKASVDKIIATNLEIGTLGFTYNNADPAQVSLVTFTVKTIKTESGKTQQITQTGVARIRNFGLAAAPPPVPPPPVPPPPGPVPPPPGFYDSQNHCWATNTGFENVDVPTGTVNGDLMLMFVGVRDNDTGNPPSGWSPVGSQVNNGPNLATKVYSRVANNEPEGYDLDGFTDEITHCVMVLTFKDVYSASPISGTPQQQANPLNNVVNAPSVSPTAAKSEIVYFGALPDFVGSFSDFTGTTPPLVKADEVDHAIGANITIVAATGTKNSPGPTGIATGHWNDTDEFFLSNGHMVAIRLN